ncbi:MAG TPA: hypothetical protein VJH67_00135 [Candidatus Paceibacterota bacterium]
MFRKKQPILTATYCSQLENIRQAIEVFTGKRVSIGQMDFNTCHGKVKVGVEEKEGVFVFGRNDLLDFNLHLNPVDNSRWITALFEDGKAKVIDQARPNKRRGGQVTMRWVGYSFIDRWEEPLHLRQVEIDAGNHYLSLEKYLDLPPAYFHQLRVGDIFVCDPGTQRHIVVDGVNGPNFAIPLTGDFSGTRVYLAEYAEVRKVE